MTLKVHAGLVAPTGFGTSELRGFCNEKLVLGPGEPPTWYEP